MTSKTLRISALVLIAGMLAACGGPSTPAPENTGGGSIPGGADTDSGGDSGGSAGSSGSADSGSSGDSVPDAGNTLASWPTKDLNERPQIWFGPLDPWSWDRYFPGQGPFQFYDLFQPDAPWQQAAEATHVMRLYPAWLDYYGSADELRLVMGNLRERRIAFTFEAGPLQERGNCNASIEGFNGAAPVGGIARRIEAVDGVLYGYDLEHGFDAANFSIPECYMTPQEVAADAYITVQAVREVFPEAKIGSIETANLDVNLVEQWITAYREVNGENLDYFHLDINFNIPDWPQRAYEIEQYVKSQGIDFGMIYFGNEDAASDEEWITTAQQRLYEYELVTGGSPDHVIFQSWHEHPQTLLPETQPGTFTNYLLQYLRTRTTIAASAQGDGAGGVTISGNLSADDGSSLANVPIDIEVVPVDGSGIVGEYTVTGIVPDGAVTGDTGMRINMECDCSGSSAFTLYEIRYHEGEGGSRVPNYNFANGFNGFGSFGSVEPQIVASDRGGSALQVNVAAGQSVGMNSSGFAVTPGASFTLTFVAKVAPGSEGSGYFDLIFLGNNGEIQREILPVEAASSVVGQAVTAGDGSFSLTVPNAPTGTNIYKLWFPGDGSFWPAYAEVNGVP